jgi:hypothetical protein
MSQHQEISILDRLLGPVARCLTPEVARRLVGLQADPEVQERIEVLAEKNTDGALTGEEREEYELYVQTLDVIAVLQVKARKLLADERAA